MYRNAPLLERTVFKASVRTRLRAYYYYIAGESSDEFQAYNNQLRKLTGSKNASISIPSMRGLRAGGMLADELSFIEPSTASDFERIMSTVLSTYPGLTMGRETRNVIRNRTVLAATIGIQRNDIPVVVALSILFNPRVHAVNPAIAEAMSVIRRALFIYPLYVVRDLIEVGASLTALKFYVDNHVEPNLAVSMSAGGATA